MNCESILLINPNPLNSSNWYPQPPLGLAMVAAVLERNGYSVKILDMPTSRLSESMLPQIIRQAKPDIVGITATTPAIKSAASIAKKIKLINKHIFVILGGPHATILPEETLCAIPEVDVIVREEAEKTLLDLLENLKENGDKSKVSGITYREGPLLRNNTSRPFISNIDELPFPSFHLLPMGAYSLHPPFGRRSPVMPIITSRGCPYNCLFCSKSIFGNKYRSNSPSYVINEIKFLTQEFGIKEIRFYDDVFTLDRKRVISICQMLKEQKMDITWTCETRVNLVDKELLRIMKDAGCYMIAYGVESGSQLILDNIRKGIKLADAAKAFRATNESGIDSIGYFILGSPGETKETIDDTIKFAIELDPDFVQFSVATPYPGTDLFSLAIKQGCAPEDWSMYSYEKPNFQSTTLSREELSRLHKKAHLLFYLRFGYLWKRMKKTRSLQDLNTDIAGLRMLNELVK